MRVVTPYVHVHPLALTALVKHAPEAQLFDVSGDIAHYYLLLAELWAEKQSLLIIEQDIEIREGTIPSLEDCPEPWCLFPYPGPNPAIGWSQGDAHFLTKSLGCTRFSAQLMTEQPGLFDHLPSPWDRLDLELYRKLTGLGYEPHIHKPPVLQHRVWGGVCSCEGVHEAYPVDDEGRFLP